MQKKNEKTTRCVDVEVVELSKKGNGLGISIGKDGVQRAVEVPFAIPGDVVSARLMRKRGGVYQGLLEAVVSPSSDRISPRCSHFAYCGGCRWQQVSYEKQLEWKQLFVQRAFVDYLKSDAVVNPILACDPPWNYRNKMEFTFSSNRAKERFLGLIIDSSNGKVLNHKECHLVNPWFIPLLHEVKLWWEKAGVDAYRPSRDEGALRTLTVREGQRTGDRLVMLTVSGNPDYALKKAEIDHFVEAVKRGANESEMSQGKLTIFLRIHQILKGQKTQFYEMLLYGPDQMTERLFIDVDGSNRPIEMTFGISPSAFFQPNSRQAEKIYSSALQLAELSPHSVVYDLYCGTGTLGICAAAKVKKVVGVELSAESALDARTNADRMGIKNIHIIQGDVGKVLSQLRQEADFLMPDLVMVDPPRVGLDDRALDYLMALNADKILYVSCNPKTQAANTERLLADGGYRIAAMQPVDQFPHTVHMENIILFKKNNGK